MVSEPIGCWFDATDWSAFERAFHGTSSDLERRFTETQAQTSPYAVAAVRAFSKQEVVGSSLK